MKYGLVIYKTTKNIGDDVQCFAARQFLPRLDVELDREHLDDVRSDEPIACIMNGWFLHEKWNWPPANCLIPHMVAFHYSEYEKAQFYGKLIKTTFLSGLGLEYLKSWGPIGCRDLRTVELLKGLGVETYFTGCMTLTLPQMPKHPVEKPYICLVDLDKRSTEALRARAEAEGVEVREITHAITPYDPDTPWEVREEKVRELLTVYRNATCVVTSRLHCALPCVSQETPVLLARKDLDNVRFQPFTDFLHTATYEEIRSGHFDYSLSNPPANSQEYLKIRNSLIDSCRKFIAETNDDTPLRFTPSEGERLRWQRDVLKEALAENLEAYKADIKMYESAIKPAPKKVLDSIYYHGVKASCKKLVKRIIKREESDTGRKSE